MEMVNDVVEKVNDVLGRVNGVFVKKLIIYYKVMVNAVVLKLLTTYDQLKECDVFSLVKVTCVLMAAVTLTCERENDASWQEKVICVLIVTVIFDLKKVSVVS